MGSKHFTKWDLVPVAAVLALAIVIFLLFLPTHADAAYAEVYQNGTLLNTLPLSENTSFTVEGNYINVVTVQNGNVAVTQTNCPGKDCQNCGWFHSGSIVCLPNGLEVRIVGSTEVDIVVR